MYPGREYIAMTLLYENAFLILLFHLSWFITASGTDSLKTRDDKTCNFSPWVQTALWLVLCGDFQPCSISVNWCENTSECLQNWVLANLSLRSVCRKKIKKFQNKIE